jgi:hypothetical protein
VYLFHLNLFVSFATLSLLIYHLLNLVILYLIFLGNGLYASPFGDAFAVCLAALALSLAVCASVAILSLAASV